LGSLGDLAGTLVGLLNGLDDTYGDGLTHVTDGETTEGRVISEGLDAQWLGGDHLDDSGITRLDEFGGIFDPGEPVSILNQQGWGGWGWGGLLLAGTTINLLQELSELAGDVSGVAIQDWSVSSADLTGVVEDNDLGVEGVATLGGVILGVTADVSTTDFLDGNVLDVESNVVSGETLNESFVVHFNTIH
jgi:hypothetical protein